MTFTLSDGQVEKFLEWAKEHKLEYAGAIGGEFTFCFTHTSLGTIAQVEHATGAKIDLTDYDNW